MATDPLKIGLLLPSTGVDSTQGTDTAKGFELYLKQISSRAGGREIRLIKEDDQAKPHVALVKIRKLVEVDRVDFLIGPISSAVALAIRSYVHEQGTPLVVPAAFRRSESLRHCVTDLSNLWASWPACARQRRSSAACDAPAACG